MKDAAKLLLAGTVCSIIAMAAALFFDSWYAFVGVGLILVGVCLWWSERKH